MRTRSEAVATAIECDHCHERFGRNRTVVHILSFQEQDELTKHLTAVFGRGSYCVEFFQSLWRSAHMIYGTVAYEKFQPLWLVYLEAHGVNVTNRAEAIIKYREKRRGT